MKAKKRILLVLAFLLVLSAGGYALLARANAKAAESASEENSIVISSFPASSLTEIQYEYNGENIVLIQQGGSWGLADDPQYHILQTTVNSMVTALCQMSASQAIENVTDYAQYGLDAPTLTVTAQAGGKTIVFSFGGQNSISNVAYLQIAGDSRVYAVSTSLAGAFSYDREALYDTSYQPISLSRNALSRIDFHCTNVSAGDTVSLMAAYETDVASSAGSDSSAASADALSTQVWYIGDTDTQANPVMVSNMLDALFMAPTAQNTAPESLTQYGLDDPALTVMLTDASGNEETVSVGIGTDSYYLMQNGDESVYAVSGDLLSAFSYSAEQLQAPAVSDTVSAESALNADLDTAN